MTDECDHDFATGIGTPDYVHADGDNYRVGRWQCDDCGQRFATVLKEIGRVDIDETTSNQEIVGAYLE